jgi:hypothetical protein
MLIFKFLFAVVVVEAITNIITKSIFFSPVREFFFKRKKNKLSNWVHELLDCAYCTSVWVGFFVYICWFCFDSVIINVIFMGFALHRLSNVLHFTIDRLDQDRTRDLNLEDLIEKEKNNED